jgi:hypothetical protein
VATKVADIYLAEPLKEVPKPTSPQNNQNNQTQETVPVKLTFEKMQEYTGNFYSDELDVVYSLKVNKGQLQLKIGYNSGTSFVFAGENKFTTNGQTFIFTRNSENKITGFSLSTNSIKEIRFVRIPETAFCSPKC